MKKAALALLLAACVPPLAAEQVLIIARDHEAGVEARSAALSGSGRMLAERDDYWLIGVSEQEAATLSALEAAARWPNQGRIALHRGDVITLGLEVLPGAVSESRGLKLVQFEDSPTASERAAFLQATGAEIVHYVPHYSYLIWAPGGVAAQSLNEEAGAGRHLVRHVRDFAPVNKIPSDLDKAMLSSDEVIVQVGFHLDAESTAYADIEALLMDGRVRPRSGFSFDLLPRTAVATISCPGSALAELAALPSVLSISPTGGIGYLGESTSMVAAGQLKTSGGKLVPKSPVADSVTYKGWLDGKLSWGGFDRTDMNNYPVIAVIDSGIDNGNAAAPTSDDFYVEGDDGDDSRIVFGLGWDRPSNNSYSPIDPGTNHGHAVASLAGGFNDQPTNDPDFSSTANGFRYGMGVSPYGRLANINWGSAAIDNCCVSCPSTDAYSALPLVLNAVFAHTFEGVYEVNQTESANETQIVNNSWAIAYKQICPPDPEDPEPCLPADEDNPIGSAYDIFSQFVDSRVRDAITDYWSEEFFGEEDTRFVEGNQEVLHVFAGGNSGHEYWRFDLLDCCDSEPVGDEEEDCGTVPRMNTIFNPGLCKNVLTAGACEAWDHASSPYYCIGGDTCCHAYNVQLAANTDDVNDVAYYSSKGTGTAGKRIKPDILAPGKHSYANSYVETSNCTSPDAEFVVSDGSYPIYERMGFGTSFSAPHVSGMAQLGAAVLEQEYSITNPSAALLKAWCLHATSFMDGAHSGPYNLSTGNLIGTADWPSPYQGFGRLNLELGFDDSVPRIIIDQTTVVTSQGGGQVFGGTIADGSKPFRAVLVWTDCYGPTAADKWDNLVNDFDMYVCHVAEPPWIVPFPDWYVGNYMDGQWSIKMSYANWKISGLRAFGDTANNVEMVHLPASSLTTGQQVSVWIKNWVLAGDGIAQDPGASGRQDFALILYNLDP